MTKPRLAPRARLDVTYLDDTPFGSVVGGGVEMRLRRGAAAIAEHRRGHGMADVVLASRELLQTLFDGPLSPLYSTPETLREECLFPAAERVRPVALSVAIEGEVAATVPLGANARELASWMGDLYLGTSRPESPLGRALFDALDAAGALVTEAAEPMPPPTSDAVFVGHATAAVGRRSRVVVDPYLLPPSKSDPPTYGPLQARDLAPIDCALITHSHPDHFDPATLLCLGADARIVVPHVERESLLAIDMGRRLEELGFRNVQRAKPGDRFDVGDAHVDVQPFYGEQPTVGEVLHPDVRNVGCTYVVEARDDRQQTRRTWLIADSGRDRDGDVRALASSIAATLGRVDLLLGGYRGFAIYPVHYLFSSVARYLLFVPKSQWTVRQKCMNDASALLDTAERCDARAVVPYADGGAPWYWSRGLGPRLDGPTTVASASKHPAVDPPPEDVIDAACARSSSLEGAIPSPVPVVVARPGDALHFSESGVEVVRSPHKVWPYPSKTWLQFNVALVRVEGSALANARRLLRAFDVATSSWREQGALSSFHFMRKPPDVRLRLRVDATVRPEIDTLLDRLTREGVVARWFSSVYEPEAARFGGDEAMDAANEWFSADTRAWLRLDALREAGGATVEPEALCAAVAHDLVVGVVDGRSEAWDIWRAYAEGHVDDAPGVLDALPDFDALVARASPEERAMLREYRAANARLAQSMRALWANGSLTAGMRSVIGTVVLFHFHRHGLSERLHAGISHGMARMLAPTPR
jgi:thiopeptide-type bacteriocin biosynthesis protein